VRKLNQAARRGRLKRLILWFIPCMETALNRCAGGHGGASRRLPGDAFQSRPLEIENARLAAENLYLVREPEAGAHLAKLKRLSFGPRLGAADPDQLQLALEDIEAGDRPVQASTKRPFPRKRPNGPASGGPIARPCRTIFPKST